MNASGYALYLLQKHGRDIIDKLEAEKRAVKHWTRDEIESMLEDYKQKLAELES
jgi:hypothetical protein